MTAQPKLWRNAGALCIAAIFLVALQPSAWMGGYFLAYICCLDALLGALAVLLIYGLSGGNWEHWLSAPLRAAVATLPVLAFLIVPLWLSLDRIFPWVESPSAELTAHQNDLTEHQKLWLQPWLQILRSAVVLAIWIWVAYSLDVWRFRRPMALGPRHAAICLMALILSASLFAVDWVMTLLGSSSTSMIGFLILSEQLIAGLALACLWVCTHAWRKPDTSKGSADDQRSVRIDLGNLLLAAVLFHGYCLYMDYLIVWETNLPDEIAWYLERTRDGGAYLLMPALLLILALPTVLLLFRRIKGSVRGLAAVSGTLLAGHLLLNAWYLVPVIRRAHPQPSLLGWGQDLLLAGVLCGLWVLAFTWLANRIQKEQHAYARD